VSYQLSPFFVLTAIFPIGSMLPTLIPTKSTIHLGNLVGGFKDVLCSLLPGEDSQFDEHMFQRGWFNHQLVIYNGQMDAIYGYFLKWWYPKTPQNGHV